MIDISPHPGIDRKQLDREAEQAERTLGMSRARYIAARLGVKFGGALGFTDVRRGRFQHLAHKEL